jgi:hypothetical protein
LRRLLALGGVVGPAGFVAAWAVAGVRLKGYSPKEDPISRLAASGASTRPLMTAGFIVFGTGVTLFAAPLSRWVPSRSSLTAAATGLATLGVAATPLDAGVDVLHGVFATAGYTTLAATPLLAARPLARSGRRGWCQFSLGAGVVSVAALAASVVVPGATGLSQRIGLTTTDLWLAATGIDMLRRGRT